MNSYAEYLQSKLTLAPQIGISESEIKLPSSLFPHQRAIAAWALRVGRCAVWADTGLGKTAIELAWANCIRRIVKAPVLILTPLAVAHQVEAEAERFKIKAKISRDGTLYDNAITIANYHSLKKIDCNAVKAVVLNEGSILKSFTGATKQLLCESFAGTPYRMVETATPSPNDWMEIGNYAEFLGVMPSNEMLSRWFINDGSAVGTYRLKGHARSDFWTWVSSWACCVRKPSDLGFSDKGYILPPIDLIPEIVEVPVSEKENQLFDNSALTATSLAKELKRTLSYRCRRVADIVSQHAKDGPFIIWCNLNDEADELKRLIPNAVEIRGSETEDSKEKKLQSFTDGEIQILITKPSICGFGMNWQHCSQMIFTGLSYSFEQLYQALRRCWRFGQKKQVRAWVVYATTEGAVMETIRRKQDQFNEMQNELSEVMRENFHLLTEQRRPKMDFEHRVEHGSCWTMHNGDCCEVIRGIDTDSIHFTIFSPPFCNLYIYSDSYRDMGNTKDDSDFFDHFDYLIPEILRVTLPGRLCAVHCKDLPMYRGSHGATGLRDFPGEIVRHMIDGGWTFHSRVTIWKCPVIERERTNNNGLLHKTVCRDSSQIRQGMADYLLLFRKNPPDDNLSSEPIIRPQGFTGYVGDPEQSPLETDFHPSPFSRRGQTKDPSIAIWRRYAEPVWWDINQMDVLNERLTRSEADERHICPLQLGLIDRAVELWTNPGDTVLSPFAGIGSEGYQSLLRKRAFVGIELKSEYFERACRNLNAAVAKSSSLFDAVPSEN